jgi:hypothetical protein
MLSYDNRSGMIYKKEFILKHGDIMTFWRDNFDIGVTFIIGNIQHEMFSRK